MKISHTLPFTLLSLAVSFSLPAFAQLPVGGQFAAGTTGTITQNNDTLTVNTFSDKAIINWESFSIGAANRVRFDQPSVTSAVLNRVLVNDPSQIMGTLSSNGRVFLVNSAGILVGQGATLDLAGFSASTLNIRNEDFLAGKLLFEGAASAGSVQNFATIKTTSGGHVYLIAPKVENLGSIESANGDIILAAGQSVQIVDSATPGVRVEFSGNGEVINLGHLLVNAARIGIVGAVLQNKGTIAASGVIQKGGRIFLSARDSAQFSDSVIEADSLTFPEGKGILRIDNATLTLNELSPVNEYHQTGAELKGSASLVVNQKFNQEAGKISLDKINLTQQNGRLDFAALEAKIVQLNALAGDIGHTGYISANNVQAKASGAITFSHPSTKIDNLSAEAGTGIRVNNNESNANPFTINNLSTTNGYVYVENPGDITLTGRINAPTDTVYMESQAQITLGQITSKGVDLNTNGGVRSSDRNLLNIEADHLKITATGPVDLLIQAKSADVNADGPINIRAIPPLSMVDPVLNQSTEKAEAAREQFNTENKPLALLTLASSASSNTSEETTGGKADSFGSDSQETSPSPTPKAKEKKPVKRCLP